MKDPRLTVTHPGIMEFDTGLIKAVICANENVEIDGPSLDELADIAKTANYSKMQKGKLLHLGATPDLHKGAGVPIGTVAQYENVIYPRIVGNDVACGMRLNTIKDARNEHLPANVFENSQRMVEFVAHARRRFFEGDRRIGLSPTQREAIARNGIEGLLETADHGALADRDGIWAHLDENLDHKHNPGFNVKTLPTGFQDWIQGAATNPTDITYDTTLGNVGGGNHFVELQKVTTIEAGQPAYQWGLQTGALTIMAHTGSLWAGWRAHEIGNKLGENLWPEGEKQPHEQLYPIPLEHAEKYLSAMGAAGNLAQVNRLICSLITTGALNDTLRPVEPFKLNLIWDAPHNLAWIDGKTVTHRKGATPAGGPGEHQQTWWGEPVIIPGSMGAASWICTGTGNDTTCGSACHGAGRAIRRGKGNDDKLDEFLKNFAVITPIDGTKARKDIEKKWRDALSQEAPWMYKKVGPAIESLEQANIANRVAELTPLATIKQV